MSIKNYKKGIKAFFLIGAVSLCLNGCLSPELTREHLPEETIEALEDAVNSMDVEGMMDCMDESTQKAMTTGLDLTMGIVGAVTGFDLDISAEDLINMMPLFSGIVGEYGIEGYPEVDFQVTKTLIKGKKATVYFTEVNTGQNQVINMEKQSGKWLMTMDMTLLSEAEADRVILPGEEGEMEESGLGGLGDLSLSDLAERPLSEIFDWDQVEDKAGQSGDEESDGASGGLLESILKEILGG